MIATDTTHGRTLAVAARAALATFGILLLLACCSRGAGRGNDGKSAHVTDEQEDHSPMSDFQKALDSFRRAVAGKVKAEAGDLQIIPGADNVVGFDDVATGALIGFMATGATGATGATASGAVIRGLAGPGGEVVLGWQGRLEGADALAHHAKILDPAASLSAGELARRVVWLLGPDYSLQQAPAPVIERDGGAATLRLSMSQAGDTGLILDHQAALKVAADHQATFTAQRVQP